MNTIEALAIEALQGIPELAITWDQLPSSMQELYQLYKQIIEKALNDPQLIAIKKQNIQRLLNEAEQTAVLEKCYLTHQNHESLVLLVRAFGIYKEAKSQMTV